jgi:predicted dehydrogenase
MVQETLFGRRKFLQSASAALATPLVLSASLRAAERPTPSERIHVGFIGTGKRGHTLLRGLIKFPQAQVVAVNDVESTRRDHAKAYVEKHYAADSASGSFKGCAAYGDYRDVLARDDIDAVVIATPDHWHATAIVEAARRGKDIYCEKPLTLTLHEAQVVTQTAQATGVVFQTGSQQRSECGGRFHRACELVRNGRIGRVHTVLVNVGAPSMDCDLPVQETPREADWNFWLGPAPWRGYHEALCPKGMHSHFPAWRAYKDYSGGQMTDWGAHHFDIAQWGLGMDHSGPVEVLPPSGDRKRIVYRYANGVHVHHSGACNGVKFIGENGWIEVNRGHIHSFPESVLKEEIGAEETHLCKVNNGHIGNWLDCIRSRKETICPAEVGARSVAVCHLGNLAYWHGRRLQWDPATWQFLDDTEANTWRDRERRSPWRLEA